MKAFFVTSNTNEVHKHHESFASIPGNEVQVFYYSHKGNLGADCDMTIYKQAKAYAPDIIIYVGACSPNTPSGALFEKMNRVIAPCVHFCSDAADDPWWPFLNDFDRMGSFSLQVALDGTRKWPLAATQLTALTVVDPARYRNSEVPHMARPIVFGFAGNPRGQRAHAIGSMKEFGLKIRERDKHTDSYGEYADFLCSCRMVVNFNLTGSQRLVHVKGRVVETALAGAMLLEPKDSPTSDWFVPGVDYLEYQSVGEVKTIVEHYKTQPEESQAIAARMQKKVREQHGPVTFWQRILDRTKTTIAKHQTAA